MATIQGIYLALFGRPADPAGLAFFNTATNNGADLTAIGDLAATAEYQNRFTGMDKEAVVNSIFQSLFGRDGEAAGVKFFVDGWNAGTFDINNIAIAILDGAQGDDLLTVNAKIAAADLFTAHLNLDGEVEAYDGFFAARVGREFIDTVTKDDPGTEAEVDAVILTLFDPGQGGEPGTGGGGGGGGGSGGANPNFSSFTLAELIALNQLPANYNMLLTANGETVADISVSDYHRIPDILAGSTNGADYTALGYTVTLHDTLANLEGDAAALAAASSYSLSDVGLGYGDQDVASAEVIAGATNGSGTYAVVDGFTAVLGLSADAAADAITITADGTAGADTIDFSGFSRGVTINGLGGNDVITGSAFDDTIVGGTGQDRIDGGAGHDTINLTENPTSLDYVTLAKTGASSDTINGFSTQHDYLRFSTADTSAADVAGTLTNGGFSTVNSAYNGSSGNINQNTSVVEFSFAPAVGGGVDLDSDLGGSATALFDAVRQGGSLDHFNTVNGWKGFLVAYQDNNAYVYYADAGNNNEVTSNEVSLVAVVTNQVQGAFDNDEFFII